ncbi:hypothetical protein PO909_031549 [Leuciscus waleckii]
MSLVATLVLFLLVFLVVIVTWRLRKKPERGHIREEEHFNTTSNTTASENQMTSISPAAATISKPEEDPVIYNTIDDEPRDPNKDVTYSTIGDAPVSDAKPPAGGTIYSTVAPH